MTPPWKIFEDPGIFVSLEPIPPPVHDSATAIVSFLFSNHLNIVIGGDGFMLESIRKIGAGHVFLGLNAGRVGFLLNDAEDFEATVEVLVGPP